ncbi:MAG: NAD(P)/FAD-dependent oxidoreductase [Actinobacteria bacterium]|nr:NAD(P)/FAD-dependent oxidoreductase [Actinomycetota bacterium]
MARVVVIGGGIGGLAFAQRFAKRTGGEHELVVIDRQPVHHFAPSFLWLLNGTRQADAISRPLAAIERWGVRFVNATVESIDLAGGVVQTTAGPHAYDELVVAAGAELAPELVPGLTGAQSFYGVDAAQSLALRLDEFSGGRIALVVPSMPFKCPAAPYEAAFLIEDLMRRRGVEATVEIHTVEPQPLPVAGPKVGARVAGMLARRGIGFTPQHPAISVDAATGEVVFEDGSIQTDLVIAVPPHRAPSFVSESELAGPAGWVPVDRDTLAAGNGVHVIGDVSSITLANGKPLPKAGVFAHAQGHVVADNLAAQLAGQRPSAVFAGRGACFLETGRGKAGFAAGKFLAEPDPSVRMLPPSRAMHLGKVLFERRWLRSLPQ